MNHAPGHPSLSRITFPLAVLLLSTVVGSVARADEVRVGVVDFRRAVAGTEDGQRTLRELQSQLEERQGELEATESELRDLSSQLEENLVMMDSETRREQLRDYQQRVEAYQEQFVTHQRALLEMEAEATSEILDRMVALVEEIARERELLLVLEQNDSSVVFFDESIDLTPELIRRYEEAH
jgi:Skp family chaperone for outer membrane proteins